MADRSNFFIMQLFHEMKQRFPAIPDRVVSECIRQNFSDKKICEVILTAKNRNYSQRQFPSSQRSKMQPTCISEGNVAAGLNATSPTDSEMESPHVEDSCANLEAEEEGCESSENIPSSLTRGRSTTMKPASVGAQPGMSSSSEEVNSQKKNLIQAHEVNETPSKLGHLVSQEGYGLDIGSGDCWRHPDYVDLLWMLDDTRDVVNVRKGIPVHCSGSAASSQEGNGCKLDGLGDNELLQTNVYSVSNNSQVTKRPAHETVHVPGVRPPPSSSEQNLDDLPLQTSLLNLSSPLPKVPFSDPRFNCGNQVSGETGPRDLGESNLGSYGEQMASSSPLPPPFQSSCIYDQNIRSEECSFIEECVEDILLNVNCSVNASGVSSHFIDSEDKTRTMDVGSKGKTSASSSVKVRTSSPFAASSSQKHGTAQGLQPTPVFAGQSLYRNTKENSKSNANPITPPKYSDNAASSSIAQLIEKPLSYTSVNLTVRQPSSDPLPPIDILSSVEDSSHYTSLSSCFPQQTFQSELQIRIGGSAGMNSSSGYTPLSPSWKSRKLIPKNQPSNQSPLMAQNNLLNQRPNHLIPSNCGGNNRQHSPQVNRREHADRSMDGPSLPTNIGRAQAEGSLPDGSKVNSSASSADHSHPGDASRCKALLMYQIERKNLLERELIYERQKLKSMQEQTLIMEKDLRERQMQQRRHATLPIMQRVHTLRQEIQVLQEECKKMTQEVDLNSDIQVPLGETDEEFYKNIYTGQRGCVFLPRSGPLPYSSQTPGSQSVSSLGRVGQEDPGGIQERLDFEGIEMGGHEIGSSEGPNWTCSVCTFRNHPALDKCEQCEMPYTSLTMAAGGGLLEPKRPCFCHPDKEMPDRPISHLPPHLLPKSIASPPSSQQVVRSPASLDSPSCDSS